VARPAPASGAAGRALATRTGARNRKPISMLRADRARREGAPNSSRGGCAPQPSKGNVPPKRARNTRSADPVLIRVFMFGIDSTLSGLQLGLIAQPWAECFYPFGVKIVFWDSHRCPLPAPGRFNLQFGNLSQPPSRTRVVAVCKDRLSGRQGMITVVAPETLTL